VSARKVRLFLELVLRIVPDLWALLVTHWPGRLGNLLRYRYYKRRLRHLGERAVIDAGVYMANPSYISIGDNTHIDRGVSLIAGPLEERGRVVYRKPNPNFPHRPGEIHIGRDVHIAPFAYLLGHGGIHIGDRSCITSGVRVYSVSHHYRNLNDPEDQRLYSFSNRVPVEDQALIVGPVVLQENTAVGLNSVVLPGSTIGRNSWVGVLSSVARTLPAGVIAAGSPATVVKPRPGCAAAEPVLSRRRPEGQE